MGFELFRQFLLGLKKYGKGDWRNISRNFVTTRTPTQVASHAQKYFIRQLSGGKDKRRSSIHDITTVNLEETTTTTTSSSPEKDRPNSPEKSSLIVRPQHNIDGDIVVRATYDSGLRNAGPMMGFGQSNGGLMIGSHHLQGNSSFGLINNYLHEHELQRIDPHGLRLGRHGAVLQMHPSQHG